MQNKDKYQGCIKSISEYLYVKLILFYHYTYKIEDL
jgi:hypothetical protein